MSESASNDRLHERTGSSGAGATRVRSEPTPSWAFTDAADREVRLDVVDRVAGEELDALAAMYDDYDRGHRAQGLPPVDPAGVREWLTDLPGVHLVARHGDRTVGHAALVPDGEGGHELVIFVHQSYHDAGIGTQLLETLLAHAPAAGVERVWLTVERYNRAAVALYEKTGFVAEDTETPTLKMRLALGE